MFIPDVYNTGTDYPVPQLSQINKIARHFLVLVEKVLNMEGLLEKSLKIAGGHLEISELVKSLHSDTPRWHSWNSPNNISFQIFLRLHWNLMGGSGVTLRGSELFKCSLIWSDLKAMMATMVLYRLSWSVSFRWASLSHLGP